MSEKNIITALLRTEAYATLLQEECRKTRKLIEGEVSTPPNSQQSFMKDAKVLARRMKNINKSAHNGKH